ncbi:fibrobacter succinogenes major paralogous domain-containing protein [uncultured Fibrobacter sp.]|uniref:fibrobacter succinogenes major paralogous domain-containing protein n=1 Tax=uncultured Fibrobacter sp. TaxID=261512 RepID=UPI00280551A8|nr:fibrobacter succinogenes major paralogous domain-containing protein [uncultured Fibrobacter sp.]
MKKRILLFVTLVAAFTFADGGQKGSFTDPRDGKTYKTVKIGNQVWMAENLNYKTANSYCYEDKLANCHKYGRLYTWAVAMDSAGVFSNDGKGCGEGKTCAAKKSVRGICPKGWHLPSDNEWKTLFEAVGREYRETELGDITIRIYTAAGKKLKSKSGWDDDNGTDDYGFSVLPAGLRYGDGNYSNGGKYASFWSSTEDRSFNAYDWYFLYGSGCVNSFFSLKGYGYSVRCLRDSD